MRHILLGIIWRKTAADPAAPLLRFSHAKLLKRRNVYLKLTRHNGRAGAHGTYNPKHNDRSFNLANSEHIVHAEARIDDIRRRTPDISATRRELDWAPRTPLIEGLRRTISYVEKELAEKNYAGISWVEIN